MEQMTTQQIIKHVVGEDKFEKMYIQFLHRLHMTEKYRMIRDNNSLFLIKIMDKGVAHVELYSADSPKDMLRSMMNFGQFMKKANYKKLYFDSISQTLFKYLSGHGVNIKNLGNNKYMVEE